MHKITKGRRPNNGELEKDTDREQTAPERAHDTSGDSDAHAVLINVYHATPNGIVNMYNSLAVPLGLAGAFHIGVQVWGDEWSFGQSGEGSGVSFHKPRSLTHHTYHKTYAVGETKLNRKDAINVIRELGVEWPGYGYHVLKRNCCHFASVLVEALGCEPLPKWMVGLSDDLSPLASFFEDFVGVLPVASCADGTTTSVYRSIADGKQEDNRRWTGQALAWCPVLPDACQKVQLDFPDCQQVQLDFPDCRCEEWPEGLMGHGSGMERQVGSV